MYQRFITRNINQAKFKTFVSKNIRIVWVGYVVAINHKAIRVNIGLNIGYGNAPHAISIFCQWLWFIKKLPVKHYFFGIGGVKVKSYAMVGVYIRRYHVRRTLLRRNAKAGVG